MNRFSAILAGGLLFGAGYFTGNHVLVAPNTLGAAQPPSVISEISDESLEAFTSFFKQTVELNESLIAENRMAAANDSRNYFALSVGGVNALTDLEEGRGVDPETFAAIYARRAIPSLAQDLDYSHPDGRVRYKGTVIRMYSRDRLEQLFRQRDLLEQRAQATIGN
ncbi:MAG: hypothetical protein KDA96_08515 [Planctomycetaceae bacterium]|nr:hypothetical protein [Planctomycetaceae bacterium]